jgi:transcriptional regulator of acetoin/glycerol metabolism
LVEAFFKARGLADTWPSPEILRAMIQGHWPGNVRELRNKVIRCVCSGDWDDLLPGNGQRLCQQVPRRGHSGNHAGLARVRRALDLNDGNRSGAARDLGISRSTLYRRLKEIGSAA